MRVVGAYGCIDIAQQLEWHCFSAFLSVIEILGLLCSATGENMKCTHIAVSCTHLTTRELKTMGHHLLQYIAIGACRAHFEIIGVVSFSALMYVINVIFLTSKFCLRK